jgi:hypothetical protein
MRRLVASMVVGALGIMSACSSSSVNCSNIQGTWSTTMSCGAAPTEATCAITQSGCAVTLACGQGGGTGTVSANEVALTFSGASATTCTATVTDGSFSGVCMTSQSTESSCGFTGNETTAMGH